MVDSFSTVSISFSASFLVFSFGANSAIISTSFRASCSALSFLSTVSISFSASFLVFSFGANSAIISTSFRASFALLYRFYCQIFYSDF